MAFKGEAAGSGGTYRVTIPRRGIGASGTRARAEDWPIQDGTGQWETIAAEDLSLETLAFRLRCTYATCTFPGWHTTQVPPFPEGASSGRATTSSSRAAAPWS